MAADNTFKGKDVAEAIDNACKSLNVPQEQLNIEVLKTGSSGIFGLCRQKSLIRVSLKKTAKSAESTGQTKTVTKKTAPTQNKTGKASSKSAKSANDGNSKPSAKRKAVSPAGSQEALTGPAKGSKPASNKTVQVFAPEILETVKESILQLLDLMGFPSELTVTQEDNSILARISGEHVQDIIGSESNILDDLQYLLRKMLNKKLSQRIALSLDAGDFRANRMRDLKNMGLELAGEVKKTGKTRSISSLNPSERRVVHMALQEDKGIRSRSIGEGLLKKVLIYRPGKGKKTTLKKRRDTKQAKAQKSQEVRDQP